MRVRPALPHDVRRRLGHQRASCPGRKLSCWMFREAERRAGWRRGSAGGCSVRI